ncbi:CPBP family intramembrane glutamic endopeptidase [Lacinutrix algicola]|uniref:CPBP family intramembrane glutamic endopeptidase n=1 Tax=Lacinutrix algicola TaxID=342954 RepID=UPI0006E2B588|nr:type II CAAX endopeptidase family protein [Lacinutrix algicola]
MNIIKAFFYTVLIFVFWVAIQLIILLPFKGFFYKIEYNSTAFGIIDITSKVGAFLLIYVFFWKPNFDFKKTQILKNYNPNIYLYILLIVLGLNLALRPFWNFELIISDYFQNAVFRGNSKTINLSIFNIISLIIIAPIIEELFYRKFLLEKLAQKNGKLVSLLISSLCFSIIHIETPNNLIPSFIVGMILGLIYLKTQKIGYSIVLHFIFNLVFIISVSMEYSNNHWLFGTNFDVIYWFLFVNGILLTYLGVKQILSSNTK